MVSCFTGWEFSQRWTGMTSNHRTWMKWEFKSSQNPSTVPTAAQSRTTSPLPSCGFFCCCCRSFRNPVASVISGMCERIHVWARLCPPPTLKPEQQLWDQDTTRKDGARPIARHRKRFPLTSGFTCRWNKNFPEKRSAECGWWFSTLPLPLSILTLSGATATGSAGEEKVHLLLGFGTLSREVWVCDKFKTLKQQQPPLSTQLLPCVEHSREAPFLRDWGEQRTGSRRETTHQHTETQWGDNAFIPPAPVADTEPGRQALSFDTTSPPAPKHAPATGTVYPYWTSRWGLLLCHLPDAPPSSPAGPLCRIKPAHSTRPVPTAPRWVSSSNLTYFTVFIVPFFLL